MRSIFLLGGFVGFSVVAVSGLQAGLAGDRILLDASVACLGSALLFRWFWAQVAHALAHAVKAKRAAQRAAEEAHAAAKATPVTAVRAK